MNTPSVMTQTRFITQSYVAFVCSLKPSQPGYIQVSSVSLFVNGKPKRKSSIEYVSASEWVQVGEWVSVTDIPFS